MGFGNRGVVPDKWSSRILWACAVGSAIAFYMVAVDRQTKNREKMLAEGLAEASSAAGGEQV